MKEFDLNLAKKGHPVCTRDGHDARIICFDSKNINYPIVALISREEGEDVYFYTLKGSFYHNSDDTDSFDLMMTSVKKEGWINIYKDNKLDNRVFNTKDEALSHRFCNYLATVEIEWKE